MESTTSQVDLAPNTTSLPYTLQEATQCTVQLHGFSDASNLAYAGAVYIRTIGHSQDQSGTIVSTHHTQIGTLWSSPPEQALGQRSRSSAN